MTGHVCLFAFLLYIYLKTNMSNTSEFIKKAKYIHGNKFDYSLTNYINNIQKVIIKCPKHGLFEISPKHHLRKYGCSKCSGNKTLTFEEFVQKANDKHENKYDYSKVVYINAFTPITIVCPKHGDFITTARNHYYKGYGCKKCSFSNPHNKLNKESFVKKAKLIHKDKYDYSKTEYINSLTNIIIICPKHGEFLQLPNSHLMGCGCKKCSSSTGEKKIAEILESLNIKFERQKSFENCRNPKTNRKLQFDFFIPHLNLCLEYDGKQHFEPVKYWGGNKKLESIKYRDGLKTKFCKDSNIKLIRITFLDNLEDSIIKLSKN